MLTLITLRTLTVTPMISLTSFSDPPGRFTSRSPLALDIIRLTGVALPDVAPCS
jgi:hypothetical protein